VVPPDPHFFGYIVDHEGHVARVIERMVEEGDTCVDVGANIGFFTVVLAEACGASGRVVAYEPEPANFAALAANADRARTRGRTVETMRAAVSDSAGVLTLVRGAESTLHQTVAGPAPDGEGEAVPCVRLDDDLPARGVHGPIKLMKVDVEGHEVEVVRGAERTIRSGRLSAMVVEVTPGAAARELEALLASLGADAECWLDGAWRRVPVGGLPHRTDVLARF
jgi:FkbM family methyltransferase